MATEETQTRQLVVFTLGNEYYALPIEQVHEIINYDEPRPVASQVSWMRGVISLRGRIIPIVDIASRLGASLDPGDHAKIVIVGNGNETAGVIVDDVDEVMTIGNDQCEAAIAGADQALIESIAKVTDRLVVQLKPEALFTGLEQAAA